MSLTSLETAVLERYHAALADKGFPPLKDIRVANRTRTLAGRFVYLQTRGCAGMEDWICLLPGNERVLVEFDDEEAELHVNLFVHNGRPATLEFYRAGRRPWNGAEKDWRIRTVKTLAM